MLYKEDVNKNKMTDNDDELVGVSDAVRKIIETRLLFFLVCPSA
jgi:hypothetical protein